MVSDLLDDVVRCGEESVCIDDFAYRIRERAVIDVC